MTCHLHVLVMSGWHYTLIAWAHFSETETELDTMESYYEEPFTSSTAPWMNSICSLLATSRANEGLGWHISHAVIFNLCPASYDIDLTTKLTTGVVAWYLLILQALKHFNNTSETTFSGITVPSIGELASRITV